MKDYYAILGVPREAEADLIKATYIALSKIYHPDIYRGDKKYALKRMQEINEAHEILKNPKKRKAHDDKNKDTADDSFFDDNQFQDEQDSYQEIIKEAWDFAKEYHPAIDVQYKDLLRLNKNLAWLFQVRCVENKQFEKANKVAEKMKKEWFNKYFGTNTEIHKIVQKAIRNKQIIIAKEINKAIKVLGKDSSEIIIQRTKRKHARFFQEDMSSQQNTVSRAEMNYMVIILLLVGGLAFVVILGSL